MTVTYPSRIVLWKEAESSPSVTIIGNKEA